MSEKLLALLSKKSSGRGRVVMTEDELFTLFKNDKCQTKTDMMVSLYKKNCSLNDIATTLAHYKIINNGSKHQFVNNTIARLKGNGRI